MNKLVAAKFFCFRLKLINKLGTIQVEIMKYCANHETRQQWINSELLGNGIVNKKLSPITDKIACGDRSSSHRLVHDVFLVFQKEMPSWNLYKMMTHSLIAHRNALILDNKLNIDVYMQAVSFYYLKFNLRKKRKMLCQKRT